MASYPNQGSSPYGDQLRAYIDEGDARSLSAKIAAEKAVVDAENAITEAQQAQSGAEAARETANSSATAASDSASSAASSASGAAASAAEAQGYRDQAVQIVIADADQAMATAINEPGSATGTALSASIDERVGEAVLGVDTIVTATVGEGQTYTLDPTQGDQFILTLTGNATLTIPQATSGARFIVQVNQDPTGGRVLTLPTALGSVTLSTTANTHELLVYRKVGADLFVTHVTHAAPGPLPWSPDVLTNKVAWYKPASSVPDPADGTIIGGSGGASPWPSESGWSEANLNNGNTLANHPTTQVVNGRVTARFDQTAGAQTIFTVADGGNVSAPWKFGTAGSYAQPTTIAAVVKVDGGAGTNRYVISSTDGTSGYVSRIYVNTSDKWVIDAGTAVDTGISWVDGQYVTLVAIFNGASSSLRINGAGSTVDAGAGQSKGLRIAGSAGGANRFTGNLGEILVVNQAVSGTDLTELEAHMTSIRTALNGA